MANELTIPLPSLGGMPVWATIQEAATGEYWNAETGSFEAIDAERLADYAVAMTLVAGTGVYRGDLPEGIALASLKDVTYYQRLGSVPAWTDTVVATADIGGSPIDLTTPLAFRNQDALESPTVMDALCGQHAMAFCRADENTQATDIVPTYVVYDPTGLIPLRTFHLSLAPNGFPFRRA